MAYNMRNPFIIPTVVDEYAGAVEDSWWKHATTGFYLLLHWSNVLLCVVVQFQRDYYENCNDDEDIVSCEWTKEIFVNSSDTGIIKRVEGKYEALCELDQGGVIYLNIYLDEIFNMSDVVITSLQ